MAVRRWRMATYRGACSMGVDLVGSGCTSADAGWGIVVIGMALTFGLSHALADSSLIGIGLLLTGRAPSPAFTLLSVTVGGLVSALVLSRIYFDFTTSSCLQSLCSVR